MITQIIPAYDWVACWKKDNETWIDFITCFALTDENKIKIITTKNDGTIIFYDELIKKLPKNIKVTIQNRSQSTVHHAKIETIKEDM